MKKKPTKAKAPEPLAGQIKPVIPEEREVIQYQYRYAPEETAALNATLRAHLDRIDDLTGQAKAAAQDYKLRIQNEQNDAKRLRTQLNTGEESRSIRAAVEFDAKKGRKRFLHPETGEFIREDVMSDADWQLPMFKPDEVENKATGAVPAAPKGKKSKAPATSEPGETSLGAALDAAAAKKEMPQIVLDLDKGDWSDIGLTKAFRAAAKKAKWTPQAISLIIDRMKETDTVENAIAVLRPHVVGGEPAAPESNEADPTKL